MRVSFGSFASLAAGLVLLAASPAEAAPEPLTDSLQRRSFVSLDFVGAANLGPGITALSWALTGQVEVAKHLFVSARVGLGWAKADLGFFGTYDQATYSNVPLAIHYTRFVIPEILSFHAGGGFALPILADPKSGDPPVREAAGIVSSAEAFRHLDLFLPRYLPLRAGGGVELTVPAGPGVVLLRPDVYVSVFAPLFDNSEAEVLVETPIEAEFRLYKLGLGFGARLQPVFFPTQSDGAQVAMEPFVGYLSQRSPFFARAGLLVGLDEPLGPGNGRDALLAARVSIGAKIPVR